MINEDVSTELKGSRDAAIDRNWQNFDQVLLQSNDRRNHGLSIDQLSCLCLLHSYFLCVAASIGKDLEAATEFYLE